MCIAVPGRIAEIEGRKAKVDFSGNIVDVNIGLIDAKVGQYVLVHAGCALEVMDEDRASSLLALFEDIEKATRE